MTNLTIANIFLFFAILCLTLSAAASAPLMFLYSMGATAMAGAVRHGELTEEALTFAERGSGALRRGAAVA